MRESEYGIENLNFYLDTEDYINGHKKPFANQFWLHGLDCDSGVFGGGRSLGDGVRVRGVRRVSAEGIESKVSPEESGEFALFVTPSEGRALSELRRGSVSFEYKGRRYSCE